MDDDLLQKILNKNISDRDIFHSLMQFRVREILLISTVYDAYIIEREGKLSELIFREFYQLNISNAPRITSVPSYEKAEKKMEKKSYDLVIIMMGVDKKSPFDISRKIKELKKKMPVLLLLNNNSDTKYLSKHEDELKYIDKLFVWNGDSKIFLAMIKYVEDKMNVKKDTKEGMVRVILLVEDSIRYYSRYLPTIYTVVMKQIQNLIEEESDEFNKMLRMRARPKILIVSNYEDAVKIYQKYKDYLLCVISDVKYKKNGIMDPEAGIKFIKHVKKRTPTIPTLLQSSNIFNAPKAFENESSFLYKNSESLHLELKKYFVDNLGFGDFIFKNENEEVLAAAHTIQEFEECLETLPNESIIYHSKKNHFSTWLIARGHINIAQKLRPLSIDSFSSIKKLKETILTPLKEIIYNRKKGEVIEFENSRYRENNYITRLSPGSLGGKGRGVAFSNFLIENINFSEIIPNISIRIPKTAIIGTHEFEQFLEHNHFLDDTIYFEKDYSRTKEIFLKAKLTGKLIGKLRKYLKDINRPIAVRSSGLFEDSLLHPFAGVYHTYLLPNTSEDIEVRLKQLTKAIKLVYSSIFTESAKNYFEAVDYKIEEEKMAVIIQEVVGEKHDDLYYPDISGVAQSYNYYPFSYMKPEDGIVVLALGLGRYVVEGEKAYRFSPKYPKLEILSTKDQFTATQTHFYAIDLNKSIPNLSKGEDITLVKNDIQRAENDGVLNDLASTFDIKNGRVVPGIHTNGPRIINFANIIKYNKYPIAEAVNLVLELFKTAMGSPVEIEFSITLNPKNKNKATFYILQIKPLIKGEHVFDIKMDEIKKDDLILYTEYCMGNGLIDDITDMILVDHDKFDKSKTLDMVREIEYFNNKLKKEDRKFILVGPGRWGTSDRWLGIPVLWTQISNAKIIVETDIDGFSPDASLGSHFFHNITSMNVGYFTIKNDKKTDYIDFKKIFENSDVLEETTYVKHISFNKQLSIMMDGKQGISLIQLESEEEPKAGLDNNDFMFN
jgi:hypothetical protein